MPKTGKTQTFQTQSVMHLSLSACWPALTIAKFLCSFIFLCLFKQEVCWGTSVSPSHNFSAPERFSWVYCGADEEILWPSLNICMDLGLDYGAQTKHPALESVSSTPISCCFSPLFLHREKPFQQGCRWRCVPMGATRELSTVPEICPDRKSLRSTAEVHHHAMWWYGDGWRFGWDVLWFWAVADAIARSPGLWLLSLWC